MHIIKVNIRHQRERFRQLLDAMVSEDQVDGCYVTGYTEIKELGERYAKFTLCLVNDKAAFFDFDA